MNDFKRSNKVTGIYWLKEAVENIRIIVRLKPQDGLILHPKFEEYAKDSTNLSLQLDTNKTEEFTFKWQEKSFSAWEIQRYTDIHNCITDTELKYHGIINELGVEPKKIFTYIHDDYHLPLPLDKLKSYDSDGRRTVLNLNSCFERLSLGGNVGIISKDTSSIAHLFRSEENVAIEEEQWTAMHVVFDHSEYSESQLLLKHEVILLSIYHNRQHNYIIVSPNLNSLELNPYDLETDSCVPLGYKYSVGLEFGGGAGEELETLLRRLSKRCDRKGKQLLQMTVPSLGRKWYHLSLEILTANGFYHDNLYIEFHIKVPEEMECNDVLKGRTHTNEGRPTGKRYDMVWHFGHVLDIILEADADLDPSSIRIFFEVISTDWWGRHRTEGYSYLPLTLKPGRFSRQLSCSRPEEIDRIEAETRRFFVGGCHLIKELDVLAKPQLQNANFKFTTTGTISLRWNTISQTYSPGVIARSTPGSGTASCVLVGAEAALRQYKKARARLAAATRGLHHRGEGDG